MKIIKWKKKFTLVTFDLLLHLFDPELPLHTFTILMSVTMFQHVILPDESFRTNVATIRTHVGMQTCVPPQVRLMVESFRADFTLVWLVTGMLIRMRFKLFVVGETFAAPGTFERFVSAVKTLIVLRQVTRLIEKLMALFAAEYDLQRFLRRDR